MIHLLTMEIDYIHQVVENKNQLNQKVLNHHQITLITKSVDKKNKLFHFSLLFFCKL